MPDWMEVLKIVAVPVGTVAGVVGGFLGTRGVNRATAGKSTSETAALDLKTATDFAGTIERMARQHNETLSEVGRLTRWQEAAMDATRRHSHWDTAVSESIASVRKALDDAGIDHDINDPGLPPPLLPDDPDDPGHRGRGEQKKET